MTVVINKDDSKIEGLCVRKRKGRKHPLLEARFGEHTIALDSPALKAFAEALEAYGKAQMEKLSVGGEDEDA